MLLKSERMLTFSIFTLLGVDIIKQFKKYSCIL